MMLQIKFYRIWHGLRDSHISSESVNGCIHKWLQGRRPKYHDPISSTCEGICELKYRPQKSTFNASDREFLFRTWVTGGIEKNMFAKFIIVFLCAHSHTKQKKKNVVDENFPLLMMTGNFCL